MRHISYDPRGGCFSSPGRVALHEWLGVQESIRQRLHRNDVSAQSLPDRKEAEGSRLPRLRWAPPPASLQEVTSRRLTRL